MYYHITTFGCQMNVHESEKLAGILQNEGYTRTDEQNQADVILFNTCAIREGAQDRVFGNVGALKKLKKQFPNKVIAVCGCMPQQKEIADKLYKTFPFVDIIFGTHNVGDFASYLRKRKDTKKRVLEIVEESSVCEHKHIVRDSNEHAFVNIIYGCNNFCTYCIVPYVRGRERSRDKQNILNEIKQLVENGYKKITLLGQNVNSYGNDSPQNGNFAKLLEDICKIEGDFKLTFMTSHPKDLSDEVISCIAKQDKILKEIHLPVQSGSNNILKKMNRKYTREHYLDLIKKIKSQIKNVSITTDIIVGFPGETEQDFNDTLDLIKQVEYSSLFAFIYSPRLYTAAKDMPNQIDDQIKHKRVNMVLDLEKQIQNKGKI